MNCGDRTVMLERLELLDTGGQYPDKYGISLQSQFYPKLGEVKELRVLRNTGKISFDEAKKRLSEYKRCKLGDVFGESWDTHWFVIDIEVPREWRIGGREEEVHLIWNSTSEALLYNNDGKPLQGFMGESELFKMLRDTYYITVPKVKNDVDAEGHVRYFVEMACSTIFGCFKNNDRWKGLDMHKKFPLKDCHIAVFNRPAWDLYWDFLILKDCAKLLDTHQDSRADQALMLANQIVNTCTPTDKSTYEASRAVARQFLSTKNPSCQHTMHALGHCHIDMGWLWPFSETRRKGARSWSSQIELMKLYPHFNFIASTPELYEWVEQDYPILFAEIVVYVEKGRFQLIGGSYVEMDANVPSGEALARQMLYGQRYFMKKFGQYCDTMHLPDTFGFSGNLPQICQLAQMPYFFTQKLKWNKFNAFPHTTFYWKGIDGSKVLTHFPPTETQVAWGDVEEVLKSQTKFKDKGRSNISLMLFGIGDGGGGPLPPHIEKLQRMADVDGLPKVTLDTSISGFFKELEKSAGPLMTWDNELFFEMHNGTYTTMANNKKGNRKSEFAIRAAEIFATLACVVEGTNTHYNRKMFDEFWKKIMLYQFHDVLPGTAIKLIYDETDKQYPYMIQTLHKYSYDLFDVLLKHFLKSEASSSSATQTLAMFNTLPFIRSEVVEWQKGGVKNWSLVDVPGIGIAVYPEQSLEERKIKKPLVTVSNKTDIEVETELLKVVLSKRGRVLSIKDKNTEVYYEPATMKEVIGQWSPFAGGNILLIHDDVPELWDAWDICVYYGEKYKELQADSYKIETKLHEVRVKFKYQVSEQSRIEQVVVIGGKSKRVDFVTQVEWHECHKLLRTYFPVNLRSDAVTCDIQNGSLRRPAVANTSWDVAKYEVCCHKFLDYSESGYGMALMSDSKYGYSARGNVVGMSLLKSSKIMYEMADMGTHHFTYSIYPHIGNFAKSDVIQEAYKLNEEVYSKWISTSLPSSKSQSYLNIDKANVCLDALKLDEETNKSVVIRVHEDLGASTICRIGFKFDVEEVSKVNVLENAIDEWEMVEKPGESEKQGELEKPGELEAPILYKQIALKPFQMQTYKLTVPIH